MFWSNRSQISFKISFNFTGKNLCRSLNKVVALRTVNLLKRDPCETCEIFKNTLFYWTYQVAASDSFMFPVCNFIKKRFGQKCLSVNFSKFLRTSFDRTPVNDCFLAKLICEFSEVFQKILYRALLRKFVFQVQVAVFQSADAVKNMYFTGIFQAFIAEWEVVIRWRSFT